jgi:hypothetical protein
MGEGDVHPWFRSSTGTTITSHNGWQLGKEQPAGSFNALWQATDEGYRWMQVDAVPIKGDLISGHLLLGLRPRYRNKTLAEVQAKHPEAFSLRSAFLECPEFFDVYWNIEVKSKHGLHELLDLLGALKEQRDLSTIMISSPVRPSILREVAKHYPEVALAAPLVHGGVFGVRFLGRKRALVNGRPYDCQQCWHRLIRNPAPKGDRPLRQLWTIRSRAQLHKGAEKGAHMIVESERVALPNRRQRRPGFVSVGKPPAVLALGGGGWRGAFGGIGSVLYLAQKEDPTQHDPSATMWKGIRQVVGISGGAFAVAALSAEPDDDDPAPTMAELFQRLECAGRTVSNIVLLGLTFAIPLLALAVIGVVQAWTADVWWAVVLIVALVFVAASSLARWFVTTRWRVVLGRLYGEKTMRNQGPPARVYRIGATDMNDGNLYAFSSDLTNDWSRWTEHDAEYRYRGIRTRDLAFPVPLDRDKQGNRLPRKLSHVVLRATSLPGVGQFGNGRICRFDHATKVDHSRYCQVPDRLVDGGMSGIFGRGLIQQIDAAVEQSVVVDAQAERPGGAAPKGGNGQRGIKSAPDTQVEDPQLVIVDAGRALKVRTGHTFGDRLWARCERLSNAVLLARWLAVSMEIAYRAELRQVADGQTSGGFSCRLVRLAEEEPSRRVGTSKRRPPGDPVELTAQRSDPRMSDQRWLDCNRLLMLRDRVHKFSLMKASRGWANRSVTVAIAACALEFEEQPDIEQLLLDIGAHLASVGHTGRVGDLAQVWRCVPVLGDPEFSMDSSGQLRAPKVPALGLAEADR